MASNTFLESQFPVIAKEALISLKNNMVMANLVNREYKDEFKKIGDTIEIRKPVKFTTTKGNVATPAPISERYSTLTITQQANVAFEISSHDMTLTVDKLKKKYIDPAIASMVQTVESDLMGLGNSVFQTVGTAGSTITDLTTITAAKTYLNQVAVPMGQRRLVIDPSAAGVIQNKLTTLYNPQIVEKALRESAIGRIAGFDTYESQSVAIHTHGVQTGTITVKTTSVSGDTTLALTGCTASQTPEFNAGDIITIANVYAVNPMTYQKFGPGGSKQLQQFVVTSNANSDSAGNCTVNIYPTIINTGAYQTVDSLPQATAAVSVVTSDSVMNLGFNEDAFALVVVPMDLPIGAAYKARETSEDEGLSLRVVASYDFTNDQSMWRFDMMYGVACVYPELGVRMLG